MRRIERLINLIAALLETVHPMPVDEIRARIAGYDQESDEAFRRAFERDKEALRAMGIPIEVVATDPFVDQADGYLIPKSRYYLPDPDLEPDELAALGIAAQAMLGGGEAAESGLLKLSIDDPGGSWTGPRVVWGADLAAEQPLLDPLYAALLDRRPIRFSYRSARSDNAAPRAVEPYGLVHRRGHWYLIGNDREKGDIRSFRVSRIASGVKVLEGSYEVPGSFDAAAYGSVEPWEIGGDAEPGHAVVRFDADLRWWPEQNMADAQAHDAPGGGLDVEIPVSNVDALVSWVIGFGPGAEIVSPPEARSRVVEHLQPYLAGESS